MYILSSQFLYHTAVLRRQFSPQIHLPDHAFYLTSFKWRIIHVLDLIRFADYRLRLRIQDHQIRLASRTDHPLFRIHTVKPCRIFRQQAAHILRTDPPCSHAFTVHQDASGLYAWHSAGNFPEVSLPQPLLLQGKTAVIGRNRLDLSRCQGLPQCLLIPHLPERRRDHIPRSLKSRQFIKAVIHQKVLRAGLCIDHLAPLSCPPNLLQSFFTGQMHHHHRRIRRFCQAEKTGDGLCLGSRRPGGRMTGNSHPSLAYRFLLKGLNQSAVFTVNSRHAALFIQAL